MKPMKKWPHIVLFWAALSPLSTYAAPPGYTTLVLLMKEQMTISGAQSGALSTPDPLSELKQLVPNLTPVVPPSKARTMESTQALQRHRLDRYFIVDTSAMTQEQAEELAQLLKGNPILEDVQFEPPIGDMHEDHGAPIIHAASSGSPDYTGRQTYLQGKKSSAPYRIGGVNALEAWKVAGGKGQNMRVISAESDHWSYGHEDLPLPYTELHAPGDPAKVGYHDTSSAGVIASKENGFGTTGIVPYAQLGYLQWGAARLREMGEQLQAGDVMQLGVHYQYPDDYFPVDICTYNCFMPLEDNNLVRNTIAYLTEEKGIHIVLAAANGNINLDHPYFNGHYDRTRFDSGGIYAGAVNSTSGLKSSFSEYGSRVDLFSWGDSVTTTTYSQSNPTRGYTHTYSGTSSANPIIAGVVASLQGVARANGIGNIPPKDLRKILVTTGYPQINGNSTQIGVQPDLDAAIKKMLAEYAGHPPTGRIGIPAEVKSDETFSTHVYAESSSNKPLTYQWNAAGFTPATGTEATLSLTAPTVTVDTPTSVSVDIYDGSQTVSLTENLIIKAPPITAILHVPDAVEGGDPVPVRVEAYSAIGKPLQYAWGYNTSSLTGNIGNSPTVTFTAANVDKETSAPLFVLVRDGTDSLQTPTQVVKIRPRQQTPYPTAVITGGSTVETGKVLLLSGASSTGNGLRYAWTAPDFTPASSQAVSPTFSAPKTPGARSVTLTVTDANNRSVSHSHIVNVTAPVPVNRPPTGTLVGNSTVDSGKTATFTANVSDPDGDPLTYTWTRPAGFTGNVGNTRSVMLTAPTVSTDTRFTLSVVVSDGHGGVLRLNLQITVKAPAPGGGCGNIAAWSATKTYSTYAEQVAYNGKVYKQNFYNINKPPEANAAQYGKEWHPGVACP